MQAHVIMSVLYMLIGVPGSGKSTWLQSQDLSQAQVLSTDNWVEHFAQLNNMTYTDIFKRVIGEATRLMKEDLCKALQNQQVIYWDQTNSTVKTRAAKLTQIPRTYRKVAVYFPTPPDHVLTARLKGREGKQIPANVVWGMKSQLEPPHVSEGFDEIIVVNN
jgi:predicted kinase